MLCEKINHGFIPFEVVIASNDVLSAARYGCFNNPIIVFVATNSHLSHNRDSFTSLFYQDNQFFDVLGTDSVFVLDSRAL